MSGGPNASLIAWLIVKSVSPALALLPLEFCTSNGIANGIINNDEEASINNTVCQLYTDNIAPVSGEKINWPSEPEAVAKPNAHDLFSGGTIRPNAAMPATPIA